MGDGRTICARHAWCQGLERRVLLAGVALTDAGANVVDDALSAVGAEFSSYKAGGKSGVFHSQNHELHTDGVRVAIEAAAEDAGALRADLLKLHLRGGSVSDHLLSGWLPMGRISQLSSIGGIRFIRPAMYTTNVGRITSEGDKAMRSDLARLQYNLSGAGVKVGILSDSFDTGTGSYATDVSTGDLPSGVSILADSAGGTDEGRAMAQIVHDVAPGASLAFATANGGMSTFANNIRALANSGAKVIVDDIQYFVEPMFQDGVINKAIDDVTAGGAVYFSAAGNEAHQGWAGPFTTATTYARNAFSGSPRFGGGTSMDFDPGPGVDDKQLFTLQGGSTLTFSVQWDQPNFSISGGLGNRSDIDVYVLDASNNNRVVAGATGNNIGGDAVETVQFTNNGASAHDYNLLIVRAGGTTPTQLRYVYFGNATIDDFAQPQAATIFGHSNAAGAAAVAAAPYYSTPPFGVDPASVEYYSSAGGVPILFNSSGSAITAVTRQQPKLTAPDGGNTTFFGQDSDGDGFPNFFGTSAAAPHAAAVAALLMQAKPGITPAAVLSAMENSALDMDEPATAGFDTGLDMRTGYGLVWADAAVRQVRATGSISGNVFVDRDGDGVLDGGEAGINGQSAFLDANNNGILEIGTTSRSSNAPQAFGAAGLISAPMSVSGVAGVIDGVNVSATLSHPNISELSAFLISPAGTRVPITLPANGIVVNQPVGGVRGENANGIWRLEVSDSNAGGEGSLTNWSLTFAAGDISASSDASGTFSFPHLEAATYSVRSQTPVDFIRTVPAAGVYSAVLAAGGSVSGRDFGYFPTRFVGTSSDDNFVVQLDDSHSRLQINDYSIAKNLISSLAFDTGDGNDQLSVDLDPADVLGISFNSGDGADSLALSGGEIHLDGLGGENLSIDVASEDATLVLSTTPENRDALLAAVNQRLRTGRNGGAWDGPGIRSSGAAADTNHVFGLAALGGWQINDGSIGQNDLVEKLVRNGDSDLNGQIDDNDFARIDAGFLNRPAPASYFTGDFDYSGAVDADDFFAIDKAFGSQI